MYANLCVTERKPDGTTERLYAWKVVVDESGVHVHTDLNDGDGSYAVEGPVRHFEGPGAIEIRADF